MDNPITPALSPLQETTDPRIAEIRGREQKATKGPWQSMSAGNCHMENGLLAAIAEVVGLPRPWSPVWVGWQAAKNYFKTFMRQEDADFVAHARQDIPYLLNALAVLQQQLAALKVQMVIVKGDLMAADSERKFLAADVAERDAQLDALRAAREAQTSDWWGCIGPRGMPFLLGKARSDAEEGADPGERVALFRVEEIAAAPGQGPQQ